MGVFKTSVANVWTNEHSGWNINPRHWTLHLSSHSSVHSLLLLCGYGFDLNNKLSKNLISWKLMRWIVWYATLEVVEMKHLESIKQNMSFTLSDIVNLIENDPER